VANYPTAATGTPGSYETAEQKKKRLQNEALLMDKNATPGTPAPPQEEPTDYNLPPELLRSRDEAKAREMQEANKSIAQLYAAKNKSLMGLAAERGFSMGPSASGEEVRGLLNLGREEAANVGSQYGQILNRYSAEGLDWAKMQEGYRQNQALLSKQQAGEKELKGMDIGLGEKQIQATRDIAEQQLGFSYANLQSSEGQAAAQRALTEKLTMTGMDHETAMQTAQLDTQKLIAGQQIDMTKYGVDVNAELQKKGLGQSQQQLEATYGKWNPETGKYEGGTAQQELALKGTALEQEQQKIELAKQQMTDQLEMFKSQNGFIDETGTFRPGTTQLSQEAITTMQQTFEQKMTEYSKTYDRDTATQMANLQAQLAASAENQRSNLAEQGKAQEAFYNMMNGLATGAIGKRDRPTWDRTIADMQQLSDKYGLKMPTWAVPVGATAPATTRPPEQKPPTKPTWKGGW